jgi:hypothetical protein
LLGGVVAWVIPWSAAAAALASRAGGFPTLVALLLAGAGLGAGIAAWRRRKRRASACGYPPGRCGASG